MSKSPGASPREKSSSLLLRKGSSTKIPLKEKIVQIYEAFFRGEDPSTGNPNFWDELFLLKVNGPFIEAEFEKLNGEQLVGLKDNMNLLFSRCVQTLNHEHNIRVVNALQTMTALVRGIFKKNLGDFGFDVINLLMGFDSAEAQMQMLVESLNNILNKDSPAGLKGLALQFFLVLVTATDNVSQNTLLEYVMINSIFESIIQLLSSPIARQSHGHDAVLMMTLLVQYRKYESANPYIVKLSILDDELALTGYAQVVSGTLTDFNREYQSQNCEPEGGFFTALSNLVGSMFVAEEKKIQAIKANDSMLLALYEAIHLNRNFITTLTHSHTPASPATPPSTPTDTSPPALDSPQSDEKPDLAALAEHANHPTNLLVTFLEYSSIVMQDIRDEARFNNAKLCLIILTCIVEDQYANSLMHDINMNFRVPLHRIQMRHRKLNTDKNPPFRPLAASVLELMVEFVMSHMMKNFPMELHMRCIGVIQRILCYQKKCRVRLQYAWKDLWTGLINLLKFLLSNESHLLKKHDIFLLASRVVNIFNLFVTYGDTFLPNPHSYDELYYEIIRMHQIFDNLFSMALRYTTTEGQWKESAVALTNHLVNIRAIINHFTPKVDSWAASNHLSSLTEDQVLEVVKNNYDSLTLKLLDSLDQYERYVEKPKESGFFTNLVRSIIGDERKLLINASATYYQNLVHEFSTGT